MKNMRPIINSHTHIFKSEDTPSFLAKKIIVWPFYYLIHTRFAVWITRKYNKAQDKKHTFTRKNKLWQRYLSSKSPINRFFNRVFLIMANIIFFFYLIYILLPILSFWPIKEPLNDFYEINELQPFLFFSRRFYYLSILLVLFVLFKNIRNTTLKFIWKQIQKRLGKEWVALQLRYINLLRYSIYTQMWRIFSKLKSQYPEGSKFVVLPMDMEFMDAGKVKRPYPEQMSDLLNIKSNNKDTIYPFLFAHPKRMGTTIDVVINGETEHLPYFDGYLDKTTGLYKLNKCAVKTYFDNGCAGVKIYPATGYYVFAKELLPLWLYCVQNKIPITTHCSVGPIFYRGDLSQLDDKIDEHPIFRQNTGQKVNGIHPKLRLQLYKNSIFQRNFTHPLNYCCLLEEDFLKDVLDYHADQKLKDLFGYTKRENPLERNLSQLKINLAHYGGAENWDQFLAQDRYDYANKVINEPDLILNIPSKLKDVDILYKYWHSVDWFSIITSMMVNYDNIYTDVSYTSHDLKYMNLLSEILDNENIRNRVMFGTDFYVVSNHKSEKQYWIDMESSLSARKWNLLSDRNPKDFLNSTYTNIG